MSNGKRHPRDLARGLFSRVSKAELPDFEFMLRALEIARGEKFKINPEALRAQHPGGAGGRDLICITCDGTADQWCATCDAPRDTCESCDITNDHPSPCEAPRDCCSTCDEGDPCPLNVDMA